MSYSISQTELAERQAILKEALKSAPFEGWTPSLMQHAESAAGLSAGSWQRLFPGGIADILTFYVDQADQQMLEAVSTMELENMKVRERIQCCIRVRLEQQLQHREAIRRAVAAQLLPMHYGAAFTATCHTVDAIWRAAGDDSTDFNWYTKRALLSKVYVSTLLFWLNDESEDQSASWNFLERRIENVMQLGKWIGKTKHQLQETSGFVLRQLQSLQKAF